MGNLTNLDNFIDDPHLILYRSAVRHLPVFDKILGKLTVLQKHS